MSVSLLQLIESRLETHSPGRSWLRRLRQRCAVAVILQLRAGELHILMIRRAERAGDPWSGHMAFPGGRMDKRDANAFAVAVRETHEEIGLSLGRGDQCIGRLSDLHARPGWRVLGMTVTPYVFRLTREVSFRPNHEVAEVIWVPLEFLLNTANREQMLWQSRGARFPVPCYHYQGRTIWGLSLMMLDELMDLVEGRNPLRTHWLR